MESILCNQCDTVNSKIAKYCSGCGFALPKTEIVKTEVPIAQSGNSTALKQGKWLPLIVGAMAFVVCFFAAQWLFTDSVSFAKTLEATALEISKNCPLMVDEGTRLDSAEALEGNALQYNYTLVGLEKEDMDIEAMKTYMKPILARNYKSNPEMVLFRKNHTKLTYAYRDSRGIPVFKIDVSLDDL